MSKHTRPGAPRGALGRVFRFALGIGLTTWLVVQADALAIVDVLRRTDLTWIAIAIALVLADRALMAYRWILLLRAIEPGRALPLGPLMRVFFVSTFIGTFLPASVGGDVVRAVGLSRLNVPRSDAVASVVVDRLLGVLSVVLMAAGGLFVVRRVLDAPSLALVGALVLAALAATALLLFDSRLLSGLVRGVIAVRFPRAAAVAEQALSAVRQYGRHRDTLGVVFGASALVQALRTLQAWSLGLALGIPAGLVWYFAFIPVIVLLMTLPISVAGLGTSQLGFQVLFGLIGVAEPDALALSVLFLALGFVGNLPGGWIFALTGGDARPLPSRRGAP